MKKLKKTSFIALLAIAGTWVFSQFVRLPFLPVHPHEAIPQHTAVVLQLGAGDLKKLQTGTASISSLVATSSLLSDWEAYQRQLAPVFTQKKAAETLALLQPTRSSGIDVLFIFDGMRGNDLPAILGKNRDWRMRRSLFKGHDVFTVKAGEAQFALARYRNLLLFARHAYLVENALSQLGKRSESLCRESGFSSLAKKMPTDDNTLSMLVNLSELGPQFAPLLDPTRANLLDGLGNLARWLQLDLPLSPEVSTWSGSFSAAEGHPLMDASAKAKPRNYQQALANMPDNLSAFAWLSCDRITAAKETGLWRTYIAPWATDEVAIALGEPLEAGAAEQFFLIKAKDAAAAERKLEALAKRLESTETTDFQVFKIRHFPKLPLDEMAGLGNHLHDPYGTVLGDYVLFSNSRNGLERWLEKYLAGQTFAKNVNFLQSLKSLGPSADGLLHFSSDRAWPLVSPFFDEKILAEIGRNPLKFGQLTATFIRKGQVCQIKFATPTTSVATVDKTPANILWKTPLGHSAAIPPAVFTNPETGEVEIFVQDASRTIYLLSKSGRIIWRRELSEPILSKIWQLDLNGDDDLQFAFNTASGIYVIDHEGEDVAGYPLKLQSPASNGVTVIDFFKSDEYEFFVACENGMAYGFDERGSPVEGWRPKTGVGRVTHPLTHFQAKGKDFLVLLDTAGILNVFQKNGEYRFPKKDLQSTFLQSPDFQADGGNFRIVACNEKGSVAVTNLEGADFRLGLNVGKKQQVRFAFADVTGDERKDYLALSNTDLAVFFYEKSSFKKAFNYSFEAMQDAVFQVAPVKQGKSFVGTVCKAKSQISLLDGTGKMLPQFPLAGTTAFVVVDLLGDGKPVVITGNGSSIVAYGLE